MRAITLRKISIGASVCGIWFIINFILTPFPIIFAKFFPTANMEYLFSSFLCYVFSLLVLSLSALYYHFKSDDLPISFNDVLFWVAILALLSVCTGYLLYNLQDDFRVLINNNVSLIVGIILLVTFILAILLHKPVLKRRIQEQCSAAKLKEATQVKKNVAKIKDIIKEEEL